MRLPGCHNDTWKKSLYHVDGKEREDVAANQKEFWTFCHWWVNISMGNAMSKRCILTSNLGIILNTSFSWSNSKFISCQSTSLAKTGQTRSIKLSQSKIYAFFQRQRLSLNGSSLEPDYVSRATVLLSHRRVLLYHMDSTRNTRVTVSRLPVLSTPTLLP